MVLAFAIYASLLFAAEPKTPTSHRESHARADMEEDLLDIANFNPQEAFVREISFDKYLTSLAMPYASALMRVRVMFGTVNVLFGDLPESDQKNEIIKYFDALTPELQRVFQRRSTVYLNSFAAVLSHGKFGFGIGVLIKNKLKMIVNRKGKQDLKIPFDDPHPLDAALYELEGETAVMGGQITRYGEEVITKILHAMYLKLLLNANLVATANEVHLNFDICGRAGCKIGPAGIALIGGFGGYFGYNFNDEQAVVGAGYRFGQITSSRMPAIGVEVVANVGITVASNPSNQTYVSDSGHLLQAGPVGASVSTNSASRYIGIYKLPFNVLRALGLPVDDSVTGMPDFFEANFSDAGVRVLIGPIATDRIPNVILPGAGSIFKLVKSITNHFARIANVAATYTLGGACEKALGMGSKVAR